MEVVKTYRSKSGGQIELSRVLPLAVSLVALLAAIWAGFIRIGWPWPPLRPTLPMDHGPLMVGGFLGTLIGLERAVGIKRYWAFGAPLLTGAGALWLLAGLPTQTGIWLLTAGSLVLVAVLVQVVHIQPALFTGVIAAGSAAWFVGNSFWLAGQPIPRVVLWWVGFLVLTIVGERLELSRLLRPSATVRAVFVATVGLFGVGLIVSVFTPAAGMRLSGTGMILMAAWLGRYDIARRRLKSGGQARFIALCLLSGFSWLAVSGILALVYGGVMAGPYYDAILHTVFLGFVMTMIFGHALIIFPVMLGVDLIYSPRFYSHLLLLHGTLALRVAGDLLLWWPARRWGGLLNGVVLLLFLANMVTSLRKRSF